MYLFLIIQTQKRFGEMDKIAVNMTMHAEIEDKRWRIFKSIIIHDCAKAFEMG